MYQFGLGVGLAFFAGVRTYFPLLMVGIIGRFADKFPVQPPFRFLTTLPVLLLLIALMAYEVLAERASGYAGGHALVQLGLKALAGGILFTGLFPGLGNFFGLFFGGFIAVLAHFFVIYFGFPGEYQGVPFNNWKDALAVAGTVLVLLLPWLTIIIWGFLLYNLVRRSRQNTRFAAHRRSRSWR